MKKCLPVCHPGVQVCGGGGRKGKMESHMQGGYDTKGGGRKHSKNKGGREAKEATHLNVPKMPLVVAGGEKAFSFSPPLFPSSFPHWERER